MKIHFPFSSEEKLYRCVPSMYLRSRLFLSMSSGAFVFPVIMLMGVHVLWTLLAFA